MASYVTPQVEIHQLFSEIPVALATTQRAFVFGPNYLLHRYSVEAEKETIGPEVYAGEADGFFACQGATSQETIDQSYIKLFGDNVFVKLGEFTKVEVVSTTPDQLTITPQDNEPSAAEVSEGRMLRLTVGTATHDVVVKGVSYTYDSASGKVTKITVDIDEELDTSATITTAALCEVQQGVEFPREDVTDDNKEAFFWEVATEDGEIGVKIKKQLRAKYNDSDYVGTGDGWGDVLAADLYVEFRGLLTTYSDTIHTITGSDDVETYLGTVHPDNPIAQAVYNAALNAGGQTVAYMAVPTDDANGYDAVLNAAELTKEVYFFVPATQDNDILQKVKSHVEAMSAPRVKQWRVAFISDKVPELSDTYTAANAPDGQDFYSSVLSVDADKKTADIAFYDRYDTDGAVQYKESTRTMFKRDVKVGDYVYCGYHQEWGVTVPHVVKVVKVINNSRLRVDNSTAGLVVKADEYGKAEVHHPFTSAEQAEEIAKTSKWWGTRRVYNVFPSVFMNNGVKQTGEFAAACVAGLVSSCLPQQPVTNLQITGITDIALTTTTFTKDQLDTIAAGGTFIVTQDLENDKVYIRHQISTAYIDNNLNTAELSVTKNVDSISYFFDDLMSPYIGKYNITPELLLVLRNVLESGITSLASTNYGLYGPQLIAQGTEILLLEQDALLKDHVNCNMKLNVPYPFNHMILKLFV